VTGHRSDIREVLGRVLDWMREEMRTESVEQLTRHFDEFAEQFTECARVSAEAAAWCRGTAAWLRGEDVPLSVYPEEGEDPADTARWKKWRVS
jgi:hypothetical protein